MLIETLLTTDEKILGCQIAHKIATIEGCLNITPLAQQECIKSMDITDGEYK